MLNPEYLAFLGTLPCAICYREAYQFLARHGTDLGVLVAHALHGRQKSDTEAAHVGLSTSRRGLSQKFPDDESIPLCEVEHHQHGDCSIHKIGPAAFFERHGADRDETIRLFVRLYKESLT